MRDEKKKKIVSSLPLQAQVTVDGLEAQFAAAQAVLCHAVEYLSVASPAQSAADHLASLHTLHEFVLALVRAHHENGERAKAAVKAEAQRLQEEARLLIYIYI